MKLTIILIMYDIVAKNERLGKNKGRIIMNIKQLMKNNFKKIKDLLFGSKDLATIGIANIIGYAIFGIFWFFVASLVGSEKYGVISYFYSIASIGSIIAFVGAGNVLLVYTAKREKIEATVYLVSIISSGIVALVLFFIFYKVSISVFVIGSVIFNLVTNEMLGRKLYGSYSKFFITQKILVFVFSIILYYVMGLDGIILGLALSYILYSFMLWKTFRHAKVSLTVLKSKFRFMLNSFGMDVSRMLILYLDKVVIYPMFGYESLGNYQLGFQLLNVLNILPFTVYQYVVSHNASGNPATKLKKYTIILSCFLALASVFLSPIVIPFLFPQFQKSVQIIQIMGFAIIPITISQMIMAKFLGIERSHVVLTGSVIFLGVQIMSIIVLGHIIGLLGAAWAVLLGASLECTYLLLVNKTKIKYEKNGNKSTE